MRDPAAVVERYFEVVADLSSPVEALLDVPHPAVRITEHPNAINPTGAVRDRDAAVAGFLTGKQLLAVQAIDVHEMLVSGDRVAVRATWRGTLSRGDNEALPSGSELVPHIAAMLMVEDGLIREHETFDCYEPLPTARVSLRKPPAPGRHACPMSRTAPVPPRCGGHDHPHDHRR